MGALLLAMTPAESGPPSSPKIIALAGAIARGDSAALADFWKDVERVHTPVMESIPDSPREMWVTFLWRGLPDQPSAGPHVLGQIGTTTGPVEMRAAFALEQLPRSDVWYRTFRLPALARLSYHLAWRLGDGRKGEPDPVTFENVAYDVFVDALNPRRYTVRWSDSSRPVRTSYVDGPGASPDRFVAERPNLLRGKLEAIDFPGHKPGDRRYISIYTSHGADLGCARCDLIVLFDAAPFLSAIPTPTILDNLQTDGFLGPLVAVFVGNSPTEDRASDLRPSPKLSAFLRLELLPWLRQRYQFTHDPRRTVIGGSSLGGLAAAYAAFANSDLFGNVISLSGAHWWWPGYSAGSDVTRLLNSESGWLTHEYAKAPKLSLRFYADVGTWEGAVMLLPNRAFRDVLVAKGYEVEYQEHVGGHDPVSWRPALTDALKKMLRR